MISRSLALPIFSLMVGGLFVREVRAPEVAVAAEMAAVLVVVAVVAPEVVAVGRVCLVDAAVFPCGWNDELLVPIAVEDDGRAWVVL